VQRCLTWEAREPDVFVNFFYGFPWSDVPDLGMCFQVITNNDPTLAERVADDLKETAWRLREEMFASTPLHPVDKAMALLGDAVKNNKLPAVLADYSDRSGNATWVLDGILRGEVARCVIGTVRDDRVLQALAKADAKAGDAFDMEVGGYMDESAGKPVRVSGTLEFFKPSNTSGSGRAHVRFGKGSVLVISQQLVQVTDPDTFNTWGLKPEDFDVFAIKSRVHFRRGFDDNGYAKTIMIVDAPGDWFGTTRLGALRYDHAPIERLYPFGNPSADQVP
jgi:microcystin degradation protein MlrC